MNDPVCWAKEEDLEEDGFTHAFTVFNTEPMSGNHRWVPLYRDPIEVNPSIDMLREAFEQGRQQGMQQERAMWELTRAGEALEPWDWPKSRT